MIQRSSLPDSLRLSSGETLKPVIGGHLENEPFLTVEHSGVDVRQNGWGNELHETQERSLVVNEAKRRKLKYRTVGVLSRNLCGKLDLHYRPYTSSVWIFVQTTKGE
jgi:hypothetical protein